MRIKANPQPNAAHSPNKPGVPTSRLYVYVFVAIVLGALLWAKAGMSKSGPELVDWRTDHDVAVQSAADSSKPTLVLFTASWCPPCQHMKRKVWTDRAVADVLNKEFLPIKVDCSDTNDTAVLALQNKYGIKGVPTMIVHDADGREVGRANGMGGRQLLDWLKELDVQPPEDTSSESTIETPDQADREADTFD